MSYDRRNNENNGNQMALVTSCLQALSEGQAQLTEQFGKLTAELAELKRAQALSAKAERLEELVKALEFKAEERNQGLHTALKMVLDMTHTDANTLAGMLHNSSKPSLKEQISNRLDDFGRRYHSWRQARLQKKLEQLQKAVCK